MPSLAGSCLSAKLLLSSRRCLLQLRRSTNSSSLSWGLMTLTVVSQDDLEAMREALKDYITFFEADLTGFTTIRALRDAASKGIGSDIEYRTLQELPWDEEWYDSRSAVEVSGAQQASAESCSQLIEEACRRPALWPFNTCVAHNSGAAPS